MDHTSVGKMSIFQENEVQGDPEVRRAHIYHPVAVQNEREGFSSPGLSSPLKEEELK